MRHTYKTEGMEIRKACLDMERLLNEWGLDTVDIQDLVLAIDEVLTNIKEHGYNDNIGLVKVEVFWEKTKVDILIIDNAKPFYMDDVVEVDRSRYLESNQIGGFGVKIIKTLMDSVKQFRNNNENLLWMSKNIHCPG